MKSAKPITRFDPRRQTRSTGATDWAALRSLTDDDVDEAVQSDADERGMLVDWEYGRVVVPEGKQSMTIRLDADVLVFYRDMGRGYQATINAVLRVYMEKTKR